MLAIHTVDRLCFSDEKVSLHMRGRTCRHVTPNSAIYLLFTELLLIYARRFIGLQYPAVRVSVTDPDDAARDYYAGVCKAVYVLMPRVDTMNGLCFGSFKRDQSVCVCMESGLFVVKPDYPDYDQLSRVALNYYITDIRQTPVGTFIVSSQPVPDSCPATALMFAKMVKPPALPAPAMYWCGSCLKSGATARCSRCRITHYCGVKCQSADYAFHKTHCSAPSGGFPARGSAFLNLQMCLPAIMEFEAIKTVDCAHAACIIFLHACKHGEPKSDEVHKLTRTVFELIIDGKKQLSASDTVNWVRFYRAQYEYTVLTAHLFFFNGADSLRQASTLRQLQRDELLRVGACGAGGTPCTRLWSREHLCCCRCCNNGWGNH